MSNNPIARILIVDDEAPLMRALCETLESQGYCTMGFTSASQALEKLREQPFDLILTDLMMPGMDGISVLKAALEIDPNLAGIVATGHGSIDTAVHALKAGAVDYVLKPFKLSAILPVLTRALTLRRLRTENIQLREAVGLSELSMAIAFARDSSAVLSSVASAAAAQSNACGLAVLLVEDGRDENLVACSNLLVAEVRGSGALTELKHRRFALSPDILAWAKRCGAESLADSEVHSQAPLDPSFPKGLSMPMLAGGELTGILHFDQSDGAAPPRTLGQLRALRVLASTGASALAAISGMERLRAAEERYRRMSEEAPDVVSRHEIYPKRATTYVNPAVLTLTGYAPDEYYADRDLSLKIVHPEDREIVEKVMRGDYPSGSAVTVRWRCKSGKEVWIEQRIALVRDHEGTVTAIETVSRDVTGRKALELQLRLNNQELAEQTRRAECANRAKSEFLASMSHEIRTPMNSILGMSELLWDTELTNDQRQYVEVFRRAGAKLLTLINDVLDLSKIEAGHLELEHVEFDLEDVIDEVIALVAAKASAKRLNLMCHLSPDLKTSLIGDPARTRQVIINLLDNAIKFTDTGEVTLKVRNNDSGGPGCIEFELADTGIGISREMLSAVFEDFTQADPSITRKYGGTGLGLSISRKIAALMGGKLEVTSTLGVGSTFLFTAVFEPGSSKTNRDRLGDPPMDQKPSTPIPLFASSIEANRDRKGDPIPQESSTPRNPQSQENVFHGERVLIVDDNPTNRLILRETMAPWGLKPSECATPDSALKALRQGPFEAVIIDSRLATGAGFELATGIRKVYPDLPLIMLTSDARQGDQQLRRSLGLAGYAIKPVRRRELLRLLSEALRLGSTRQQQRPHTPVSTAAPTTAKSHGPLEILIAEDSADNRLLLQAYLHESAYVLVFAEDGQVAVENFSEGAGSDLILMDIQMPRMDGLTATRAIRQLEKERGLNRVPILALTANASPEDVELSREAGCDVHLSKPITKHTLLSAIEEFGRARPRGSESSESVSVGVPAGLEAIVPGYLARRRREVTQMTSLLAASDYDSLRIMGHDLKGSGSSYGFPLLTQYGVELESAARRADHDALAVEIMRLGSYLSRVQLVNGG